MTNMVRNMWVWIADFQHDRIRPLRIWIDDFQVPASPERTHSLSKKERTHSYAIEHERDYCKNASNCAGNQSRLLPVIQSNKE